MGKMTVYHGSYTDIPNPRFIKSRPRDQFWSLARFKYPTHQINFCTAEALQCLEFVCSKEVLQ